MPQPRPFTAAILFPALCALLLTGGPESLLQAHDSPEHVVAALTRRIKEQGETAALLLQRAVEQRALRQYDRAVKDLQRALVLDPKSLPALTELSQVYLAMGQHATALATIDRTIALATDPAGAASFHFIKAEIHTAAGEHVQALREYDRAFAEGAPQLDWYLLRSEAQAVLGNHQQRLRGLAEGLEATGSSVLKAEWIEALIDAGQAKQALSEIEPELEDSRWQSSWLIRRGRARLKLGQIADARADLSAAIAEMNQRLKPDRPDLTLLADRGRAFALINDRAAAQRDLAAAVKGGADDWVVRQLRSSLDGANTVPEKAEGPAR